ncbi:MAG: VPLPA-CTERM sorting domain-containing protein [Desulfobaccales bacterium]
MRGKAYLFCVLAALIMALPMVPQASATLVNDLVTFSATNFTSFPVGGTSVPDPVTGSFTITFDNSASVSTPTTGTTTGISYVSLNIPLASALSFSYYQPTDFLYVGGLANGPAAIQISPGNDDFYLQISNFTSATPTFVQLGYAEYTGDYFYTTSAVGQGLTVGPAPVPLPGTLPLVLSGLGALVAWRRRSA